MILMELIQPGVSQFLAQQEAYYRTHQDLHSCVEAIHDALEKIEMRQNACGDFVEGLVCAFMAESPTLLVVKALTQSYQSCHHPSTELSPTSDILLAARLKYIFTTLDLYLKSHGKPRDDGSAIAERLQDGVGEWTVHWCTPDFYRTALEPFIQTRSWRDLLPTILDDYDVVYPFDALRWWMIAVFCRVHAKVEPSLGQIAARAGLPPRKLTYKEWKITRSDVEWVTRGMKADAVDLREVTLHHCHSGTRTKICPNKTFPLDFHRKTEIGEQLTRLVQRHSDTSVIDNVCGSLWPAARRPDDSELRRLVRDLELLHEGGPLDLYEQQFNLDYLDHEGRIGHDVRPRDSAHEATVSRAHSSPLLPNPGDISPHDAPSQPDDEVGADCPMSGNEEDEELIRRQRDGNFETSWERSTPVVSPSGRANRQIARDPCRRLLRAPFHGQDRTDVSDSVVDHEASFSTSCFRSSRTQVLGHEFLADCRGNIHKYVRALFDLRDDELLGCSDDICEQLRNNPPAVVDHSGEVGTFARAIWQLVRGDSGPILSTTTFADLRLMTAPKALSDAIFIKAEMMRHARDICPNLDLTTYVVLLEAATAFCMHCRIAQTVRSSP